MTNDPQPQFARIPAGKFIMGAEDGEEDERPAHPVYLDEYHIAIHPVTNEEYARFVRDTGYPPPAVRDLPAVVDPDRAAAFHELAAPYVWYDAGPPTDRGRHPVTLVGFEDATEYCRWLAARHGTPVRLPTEAEWEKAARGGLERKRFPWGDEIDPARANFLPDSSQKRGRGTRPVGSYPPNGYQLFDMVGNVWEWVADWYSPDYYARSASRNPRGPESGRLRLVRGGAWVNDDVRFLRCAHRHKVPVDSYAYSIGFRVAYSSP